MLRPRVTHSAAHRNIRQKRPWMEYSGTTSCGVKVRGQGPGGSWDWKLPSHQDLWELKGLLAAQAAEQMEQAPEEEGGHVKGLGWA